MAPLLAKLREHTITLRECYMLRDWLSAVFLEGRPTLADQKIIAIFVKAAVESLIATLEAELPGPPAELPEGHTPTP
jgi:hypothetical protein